MSKILFNPLIIDIKYSKMLKPNLKRIWEAKYVEAIL